MTLLVLAAAAAVCASLTVLVWSVTAARSVHQAAARNLVRADRADLRALVLERSAAERATGPLLRWASTVGARLTDRSRTARLRRLLVLAGSSRPDGLERVLAGKTMLTVVAGLGGLFVLADRPTGGSVLLAAGLVASAWFVPDSLLRARARRRQEQMRIELPDTLDQVTVCVEAGDGFESALRRVARTGHGPLAHELRRALHEMQVGATRGQALRAMAERTDLEEFRRFVTALLQAESYGIPIARIMRTQAGEMRVRRRQRSEEHALKVPVKLVFPLITCILPSLFIVILGPAAIRLTRFFGGTPDL